MIKMATSTQHSQQKAACLRLHLPEPPYWLRKRRKLLWFRADSFYGFINNRRGIYRLGMTITAVACIQGNFIRISMFWNNYFGGGHSDTKITANLLVNANP